MKKARLFLCILPYFNFGGAATLYYRMLKWSGKNGYYPILMTKNNVDFNRKWIKELEENNIHIIFYEEKFGQYHFYSDGMGNVTQELNYESIICITSSMFEYFVADQLKRNVTSSEFKIYFYVIHPLGVFYTQNKWINHVYKRWFLEPICRSGSLMFMDEETRNNYWKLIGMQSPLNIIRLGMEIKEYSEAEILKKMKAPQINMISICRMEIPFKGYVLGLIDDFVRLQKEFSNLRLTIIGDGPEFYMVEDKVKGFGTDIQSKIELLGDVPYSELDEYIRKSYVLVGMGTTILDGAGMGVPCCVTASYQMKDRTYGLFHNHPNILGYTLDKFCGELSTIYDDVSQILKLDQKEYLRVCHKTYEAYKENYDINIIMPKMGEIPISNTKMRFVIPAFFKSLRFMVEYKQKMKQKVKGEL